MNLLKNSLAAGIGIAVAAGLLAPILVPAASRMGRPLAKSLVRGGMGLYERGRELIAVAGESVEDIMAEIRAETAVPDSQTGRFDAARSDSAPQPAGATHAGERAHGVAGSAARANAAPTAQAA